MEKRLSLGDTVIMLRHLVGGLVALTEVLERLVVETNVTTIRPPPEFRENDEIERQYAKRREHK